MRMRSSTKQYLEVCMLQLFFHEGEKRNLEVDVTRDSRWGYNLYEQWRDAINELMQIGQVAAG